MDETAGTHRSLDGLVEDPLAFLLHAIVVLLEIS